MTTRIVLVDPRPEERALALRALRGRFPALDAHEVADPDALAQAVAAARWDAVVTEYRLGWTDGIEVLEAIRQRDPGVPVVMFTGSGSEEACAAALKAGAFDYLVKRPEEYARLPSVVQAGIDFARVRADWAIGQAELAKRAEELAASARRKDEFVAMLAHELRNPLAPLRNALHLLEVGNPDAQTIARLRATMGRQIDHLTRLVDDLLDVSRVTLGKVELRHERVDLSRLVREVVEDRRERFSRAGLELAHRGPEQMLCVQGDPTRLRQVLDNLLDNAAKFTQRGGRVSVTLARRGQEAVLEVQDSGVGMEPAMVSTLFEAFHQEDRSRERSRGGLGIGLALAKGLVELHDGRIEAASAGPGQGSTFGVFLPLAAELPALADDPERAGSAADRALRVLLIEDNRDAADTMRMLLDIAGHDVKVAYRGDEGFRAALREKPDVVVSDIGLPGMDGYEIARELRKRADMDAVRLIAVTGYGQDENRRMAAESGFEACFVKPVDPGRLLRQLSRGAH